MNLRETMKKTMGPYWGALEEPAEIRIKETPFMLSTQGEIVCLPNTIDEPVVGVVGMRGSGKSYTCHTILDRLYWDMKKMFILLNDRHDETFSWSKPNKEDPRLMILNEEAKPLPIAYCLPHTATSVTEHNHIRIGLPVSEVLDNPERYMTLGRAEPYLKSIIKKSGYNVSELQKKILEIRNFPLQTKLRVIFEKLVDEGLLDTETSGVVRMAESHNKISGNKISDYIIPLLMRIGVVPSILTADLIAKDYYHPYIAYIIRLLNTYQRKHPYFSKKENAILVFIDELEELCSTEVRGSPTAKAIKGIAARGRMQRIGLLYATQPYSRIERVVRVNTSHLLAFRYKDSHEAGEIASDFSLSKYQKDAILGLKKFEMLACTSTHFVTYNSEGDRDKVEEPIHGIALPTLSMHQRPTGG